MFFILVFIAAGIYASMFSTISQSRADRNLFTGNSRISFATWGSPGEREIIKFVSQKFTENTGTEVDVLCFSDNESCRNKVITQFAAGEPFDVFYADDRTFSILAQKGWLLDLSLFEAYKFEAVQGSRIGNSSTVL